MKNCKDCKHTISESAKVCPQCGADLRTFIEKIPRGAWLMFAILVLFVGMKYSGDKDDGKEDVSSIAPSDASNSNTPTLAANNDVLDSIHEIMLQYHAKYQNAQNEIQESDAYRQAMTDIRYIMSPYNGKFHDWKATLTSIKTLEKGGETLSLRIKSTYGESSIVFKTPCEVLGSCGISSENPVYDMVRELKEGDNITFSGSFLSNKEDDNLSEDSYTELGGMLCPEFNIKFTEVKLFLINE